MRVLIVDDDPDARRALSRLLVQYGHDVLEAESAELGVEMMRAQHPDVVLLDLVFPAGEMDGWDVQRVKMLDSDIRGIPMVIITGSEDAMAFQKTLVGPQLVMGKPAEGAVLAVALKLLVGGNLPDLTEIHHHA